MSTGLSSEGPMVSFQGFIWPLLDCATHSPCHDSANPVEAGGRLSPPFQDSPAPGPWNTSLQYILQDLNTDSPQPFPASGKVPSGGV